MGVTNICDEIIKKTAKRGGLKIKHMQEGYYTVKITKTGYKEQEVKISVCSGEMTYLKISLEKE